MLRNAFPTVALAVQLGFVLLLGGCSTSNGVALGTDGGARCTAACDAGPHGAGPDGAKDALGSDAAADSPDASSTPWSGILSPSRAAD
jgi:hypothetical protein